MHSLKWLFYLLVGKVTAIKMQDSKVILPPTGGDGNLGLSSIRTGSEVKPEVVSSSTSASSSSSSSSSSSLISSFFQYLPQSDEFLKIFNRAHNIYSNPEIIYKNQLDVATKLGVPNPNAFANMYTQPIVSASDILTTVDFNKLYATAIEKMLKDSGISTEGEDGAKIEEKFLGALKRSSETLPPSPTDADYLQVLSNAFIEFLSSFPNLRSDQLGNYFLQEVQSLRSER